MRLTDEQVAAIKLDTRPGTVVGHIKKRRVWAHILGETIYGNKVKEITDEEILAIFNDSRQNTKIASDYGISTNRVWLIKHGVTYTRVTKA